MVGNTMPFIWGGGKNGLAQWYRRDLEKINASPDKIYKVVVPIEGRPLACPTPMHRGFLNADYYRERRGGMSRAIPFVAGLFTAAREAQPELSKENFFEVLRETAQIVAFERDRLPVVDIKAFMTEMKTFAPRPANPRYTCVRNAPRP